MPQSPPWMTWVLRVAGVYNLAWGAWLIVDPLGSYRLGGLATPDAPLVNTPIWQCLGMVIGVYGIGYLIASTNPLRHWPIIAVGLLGKIFGPIGYLDGAMKGNLPWSGFTTILFNDATWWVPFGLILARVYRDFRDDVGLPPAESPESALATARTAQGPTLAELSHVTPVLLIFLRHFG